MDELRNVSIKEGRLGNRGVGDDELREGGFSPFIANWESVQITAWSQLE